MMASKDHDAIKRLERRVAASFFGRFSELRPVQLGVIEPLLGGSDLVVSSGTGSGKTEAVMAPLVSRYLTSVPLADSTVILYIAPTKALVNDVERRLRQPLDQLGLQIGIRHGDRDDLKSRRCSHVLVTTPESLDVLLFRSDNHLQNIRAVVVDEVHLLYNTQRGLQLSILLRRLRKFCERQIQFVALSATIGKLEYILEFFCGRKHVGTLLTYPNDRTVDAMVFSASGQSEFVDVIRKLMAGEKTKLLIFANSRKECERLAEFLGQDSELGQRTFTHYSSLSTEMRLDVEHKFGACRRAICIATSTLELGIDIGDIDATVLWGSPDSIESFLQRIGRGNRRLAKANVVCLIPDNCHRPILEALSFLSLLRLARCGLLSERSPFALYGAACQQALSLIGRKELEYTRIAEIAEVMDHLDHVTRGHVESILAELADHSYLQHHGIKNRYGCDEKLHQLVDYRMIYGNFPAGSQQVDVKYHGKLLGSVPAANLLRFKSGSLVRFAGQPWRIGRATFDQIEVTPSSVSKGAGDFLYYGAALTKGAFLVNSVWEVIQSNSVDLEVLSKRLRPQIAEVLSRIKESIRPDNIPCRRSVDGIIYYTFAGYLVNKAIALISEKSSFAIDDWSIKVASPIDFSGIPTNPAEFERVFSSLFEADEAQTIYQRLLPIELQQGEHLQAWLCDTAIPAALIRLKNGKQIEVGPDTMSFLN